MPSITIDGIALDVAEGSTILDAARVAGIRIPTLCFLKERSAIASCRVCVVDVEGFDQPVPSCATSVQDGMKVTTSSPRVEAYRRIALELIIADHGLDSTNYCFSCDKNGACELQAVCREYGVLESPYEVAQKREPVRDGWSRDPVPLLRSEPVHPLSALRGRLQRRRAQPFAACGEARRAHADRGAVRRELARHRLRVVRHLRAGVPHRRAHREAPSGVSLVGDRARAHHMPALRRGLSTGPREAAPGPSNQGLLCVKGRSASFDFVDAPDRIRTPLVKNRETGEFEPATWDEALDLVARRFTELRDAHGGESLAAFACSTCSRRWRASCSKRTTWTVARVFDTPPRSPVWRPCLVPAR